MRAWIVNHFAIPPSESGGTRHFSLARVLIQHGMEPTIIAAASNYQTGKPRPMPEGENAALETIENVPFLWLRAASHGKAAGSRLWSMLGFAWAIATNRPGRYLIKPDVIMGSSPHLFAAAAACFTARRLRVPFVLEIRDLWPDSLVELGGYSRYHPVILTMKLLERYVYRHASRIVTLLPEAAPYFAARGSREDRVVIIPNGVDVTLLENKDSPVDSLMHKEDAAISSGRNSVTPYSARFAAYGSHLPFTILYAGAHGIPNQLETLIEAATILQNQSSPVQILLVGDGISKPALQALATERGLRNVTFRPPVPKQEMGALLDEADAYYLQFKDSPLYQWGVSPNKLFDYLLAGKPVIYAANVRTSPVASAQAGVMLKPGDAPALAEAITNLATMPEPERDAMGARGRAYVLAHHHFETLGKKLADCLKELVPEKPKRDQP